MLRHSVMHMVGRKPVHSPNLDLEVVDRPVADVLESERIGTIGSLGGPVDLQQLLHDGVTDNLEVKPQTEIPLEVGDDFTFDHLPQYPDRNSRMRQSQDLTIAFGLMNTYNRLAIGFRIPPAAKGV